jgi:hypothetical protein
MRYFVRIDLLEIVPLAVVSRRKSLANAWRPITKTNVLIAGASIAEFSKTPVFQGLHKIWLARAIH